MSTRQTAKIKRNFELGCFRSMGLLSGKKSGAHVAFLARPHRMNNPQPIVGQSAHRHAMALTFGSFATVILSRPFFLAGRLPGKLVQGVTQRLDASHPTPRTANSCRSQRAQAKYQLLLASWWVARSDCARHQSRPINVGQAFYLPLATRPTTRCQHGSKKGFQPLCHRLQFVRPMARVGQPGPTSSGI